MTERRFATIAFSGSLRSRSSNSGLLRMCQRLAPPELAIEVATWAAKLPMYNPDLEVAVPTIASRWRTAVIAADAVILAMPEYNHGPSAHGKNAIDWLSRPWGGHALRGKTIAVLSSGESGGGRRVQAWLEPVLTALGNTVVESPRVAVVDGANRIQVDGTTDDPTIEQLVSQKLQRMVELLA